DIFRLIAVAKEGPEALADLGAGVRRWILLRPRSTELSKQLAADALDGKKASPFAKITEAGQLAGILADDLGRYALIAFVLEKYFYGISERFCRVRFTIRSLAAELVFQPALEALSFGP
ncbi:MAG: hypothetical protein DMG71_13755, partial [Acidobacteria bacterium]